MLKDFFLGFVKIHILYHASREEIYGVKILEELARHGYRLSPGTLYPTLHRLTKEGYLENRLRDLVNRLGLTESVLFTGFQSDIPEIIASFDIAVLPSFFEGMGRVLLEAMAMERPVVASRVGGIPELVKDGINGFLTTPGDAKGLAESIKKLLNDKKLAISMGKEGRKRVTDKFSAETMVKSINKVYNECLVKKGIKLDD